jgi:hypothetical protein
LSLNYETEFDFNDLIFMWKFYDFWFDMLFVGSDRYLIIILMR